MFDSMTKSERAYFNAAKAVSELSDHHHRLGCVVVNKHRIISSGHNSDTRCHRIQAELDMDRHGVPCPGKIHAETAALLPYLNSKGSIDGASIYIYREHRDGSPAKARPCPSCMKLIKQCGIRRIYYTTDSGIALEKIFYN